jgi:hypothetical protein
VDIGQALEAAGEGFAHGLLALRARPPGIRTAGHLEHAVIGKAGHDRIEIVRVERGAQAFEQTPDIAHHTLPRRYGHMGADTSRGSSGYRLSKGTIRHS